MTQVNRFPEIFDTPLFRHIAVVCGDPRLPDAVKPEGRFTQRDFDNISSLRKTLSLLPGYTFSFLDRHATLLEDLQALKPDFVLNLCDNGFYNDPLKELHVPACLEVLGIPYSGATPACLGKAYDKQLVSAVASSLGIPVPKETYIFPEQEVNTIQWELYPAFLKLNFADNSVGIDQDSIVHNRAELEKTLARLRVQFPLQPVLLQEYLEGTEYRFIMLGNKGLDCIFLPFQKVFDYLDENCAPIVTYDYKYDLPGHYSDRLKVTSPSLSLKIQKVYEGYCKRLFERLDCRDYATFDFRTDAEGVVKLIDVNPNPSWDAGSLVNPDETNMSDYLSIVRFILEAAQWRYREENSVYCAETRLAS